jgi:hypothetical protein
MQMHFRKLAEASLTEIHQMARDAELPESVLFYAQYMAAFMSGDMEKMGALLQSAPKDLSQDLLDLVNLRTRLRAKNISAEDIKNAEYRIYFDVLEAEKYFVLSRAWELLGREDLNIKSAMQASALYKRFECPKKSLRAFYNSVVAESRLTPYKNFIAEYQTVITLSREVKDEAFAGMALSMLSREYQIVGLPEKALICIEEGLQLLENERGSLHYFAGLLQKAHLLMETKNTAGAIPLLIECKMASFPEIRAIRTLLECSLEPGKEWPSELEKHLLPSWRERLPDLLRMNQISQEAQEAPTTLEFKVLKLLWSGPVPKWDLIERIYPEEQNSTLSENRFKNLVARLRKKFPEVLQFNDGQYFIQKNSSLDLSLLIGESR